ncbi:caspase family protein [Variovorax sp. J22R133]|uniref:caspase family protein n=1 Tax=Variovorax brevis TaxID=3053503 RepID=UPI002578F523|nr:caspase family protein [Variovorax sp. J22R133]MDM0110539.1 caspase family protein [Variovorax sp. J22R133]
MTVVYEKNPTDGPGVHVFAIGVGRYPHLIGGSGPLAEKSLGLAQLSSPPVSVKAVVDWFLASLAGATPGFANQTVPLGSVEALASAEAPVSVMAPGGPVQLDVATRQNVQVAFQRWLGRMAGDANNIGVFYFCGHGVMAADHYLFLEDFGESNDLPWDKAFDISNTMRAVERDVPGALYFFIDACREVSREMWLTQGASPTSLKVVELKKPVLRSSASLIMATGEGRLAFAAEGRVSRFTDALLTAMSGYAGVKGPGSATWDVDGESIAGAIRKLLELGNKTAKRRQISDQTISGDSVPLLRLGKPPLVKVELDLSPEQARALATMYLLSAKGVRNDHPGASGVFLVEVPRGMYSIGATALEKQFEDLLYEDQDLIPPSFAFTMRPS